MAGAGGAGAALTLELSAIVNTQNQHTATLAQHTATLAQHTATLAQHTATLTQLCATQAQHTATLNGIQASLVAIQAQLAAVLPNANALAARVTGIIFARNNNNHDREGVDYEVVPLAGGQAPASWPAGGLNRASLRIMPIATVDALLGEYGLPAGPQAGAPIVRRNALARHIGTTMF